jgi:EmrB/QacA subfamily drug resistance transporter
MTHPLKPPTTVAAQRAVGAHPAEAAAMTSKQAFMRVFPGVMVAMFLAAADQTILATALPTIASSLGGLEDLSWVVVSYLLAATVAAPIYGHLGDRFGRRRMLLVALTLFTLASLGCAVAPTLVLLIIARAVQGLGGGGLMTLAQALIGEHVAPRERGRFAGYFATVFALASTSGPVLGAFLTEHLSWRAVFAINLPLGLLAALLALRVSDHRPVNRARFRPDIGGALLFSLSTLALLFALSSAGNRFAWISWSMVTLIGGALCGYIALGWWERRASDPVIPLRFIGVPAIARSNAVVLCFGAALFSSILYLPLFLQLGRGLGIGQSGLLLLPITLSMVTASAVVGKLVTKTGNATLFPQLGMGLATVSFLGLAISVSGAPTALIMVLTVLSGVGIGMVMPPVQVMVQLAAGRESLGSATATISICRAIGGAIGVALTGAILFAMIGGASPDLAAIVRKFADGGPAYIEQLSPAQRHLLAAHLDAAYRVVFLVIAGISAIGALLARTIPKPDWTAGSR